MKPLSLIISLLFASSAYAQNLPGTLPKAKHGSVTYKNEYFISSSHYDYKELTSGIVAGATTDYEKARAIYLWLCKNIEYDRSETIRTADEAWDQKRSVCQGYCELFYRMAETQGLKPMLIYGKAKPMRQSDQLIDHVWLSLKTDHGQILMDPTWGAGHYINGRFIHITDPLIWFNVDPEWFAFSHLAKKDKYQFLPTPLTEEQFIALPFTTPRLEMLGISGKEALQLAEEGQGDFPRVFSCHTDVKVIKAPVQNMHSGQRYTVTLQKIHGCRIVVQNGNSRIDESTALDKHGNGFSKSTDGYLTLAITPADGKLQFFVISDNDPAKRTIPFLEYTVR